jgi:hypothetical protein
MGIFSYGPEFKAATKAEAAPLAAAAAQEAQIKQQQQAAENSQLTNNILGGTYLYNQGMGDNSPIADYLGGLGGGGEELAMMDAGGGEMAVDPATWQTGVEGTFQGAPTVVAGPEQAAALRTVPVEGGMIGGATPPPAAPAGMGMTVAAPAAALAGYGMLQDNLGEAESDIYTSMAAPMLDVGTAGLHREGGGPIGDLFDDSELEDMMNGIGDFFGGLF